MFLPVLLVRDFGAWSFLVFAVPNVLGAAAMGLLLRGPGATDALLVVHRRAIHLFSAATGAFQVFFLCWLLLHFGPAPERVWALLAFVASLCVAAGSYHSTGWARVAGAATWLFSAGALLYAGVNGGLSLEGVGVEPRLPTDHLLYLAPVCTLGFLLCPYLDVSFYHARRQAPGATGSVAFVVGFGVLFAAMIVGTFLAYRVLSPMGAGALLPLVMSGGAAAITLHMAAQLGFTLLQHSARIDPAAPAAERIGPGRLGWSLAAGVGSAVAAAVVANDGPLATTEIVYRLFMGLYGLVFPAYVLLCMLPTRDGHHGPSRGKLAAWATAVLLAAPCYWLGFVEQRTPWLGAGVAVVLLARLVVMMVGRREAGV